MNSYILLIFISNVKPAALLSMVEVEYIFVEVLRSSSRVSSSDKLPLTSDGELARPVVRRSSVNRGLACSRGDALDAETICCCC